MEPANPPVRNTSLPVVPVEGAAPPEPQVKRRVVEGTWTKVDIDVDNVDARVAKEWDLLELPPSERPVAPPPPLPDGRRFWLFGGIRGYSHKQKTELEKLRQEEQKAKEISAKEAKEKVAKEIMARGVPQEAHPAPEAPDAPIAKAPAQGQLPVAVVPSRFQEPYINRALQKLDIIAANAADCYLEYAITPELHKAKEYGTKLPTQLKAAADWVLNVANVLDQHFNDLFNAQELGKVIKPQHRQHLLWLTSNEFAETVEESKAYKAKLKSDIIETIQKHKDYNADQKGYLLPCTEWIFNLDKSLADYLKDNNDPNSQNPEHARLVSRLIMRELAYRKITLYCDRLNDFITKKLPEATQDQVHKIVGPITRYEGEQLFAVIRRLDWTKLIDGIVNNVYQHTEAYLEGVKAVENFKKEYARNYPNKMVFINDWAAYQTNPNALSYDRIIALNNNKSTVIKLTEDYKREETEAFLKAYLNHKAEANDTVHEIVRKPLMEKFKMVVDEHARTSSDIRVHFNTRAEILVNIFFSEEMKKYQFWKERIAIAPGFVNIFVKAKELTLQLVDQAFRKSSNESGEQQGVLSKDTLGSIFASEPVKMFGAALHQKLVDMAREKGIKVMAAVLQDKLIQYSDPDELKELMATSILPEVLVPKMVLICAQNQLLKAQLKYHEMFFNAIKHPDTTEKVIKDILEKLYKDTNLILRNEPLLGIGFTNAKFNELVSPTINELIKRLKGVVAIESLENWDPEVVLDRMKGFNVDSSKEADNRPYYGKLIYNIALEMTSLKNTWTGTAAGYLKESLLPILSDIFVRSMNDTRLSPAFTIDMVMSSTEQKFRRAAQPGNVDPVHELLLGTPKPTKPELRAALKKVESGNNVQAEEKIKAQTLIETTQNFEAKFARVTNLIYDIAIDVIRKKAGDTVPDRFRAGPEFTAEQLAKKLVLGDARAFNKLVMDVYVKLFGDHAKTLSIIAKSVDLIFTQMRDIDEKIKAEGKLQAEAKQQSRREIVYPEYG